MENPQWACFPTTKSPGIGIRSDGRGYPHGAPPDGFAPQYLCLAYIKFETAGLHARHAYFPLASDPAAFAIAEFAAIAATGQWATAPIRDEANFENFTFGSPQLIVFHIDPTSMPVKFDPHNLIQLAEWSAHGPKTPATRKARNNSFLNPEIKSWSGKDVLALENWYVDDA